MNGSEVMNLTQIGHLTMIVIDLLDSLKKMQISGTKYKTPLKCCSEMHNCSVAFFTNINLSVAKKSISFSIVLI